MSQSSGMLTRTLMFLAGILILCHLSASCLFSGILQSVFQTIAVMVGTMMLVLANTKFELWPGKAQFSICMAMLMLSIGLNEHIVQMQNSMPCYWLSQMEISMLLILLPFTRKVCFNHGRHHRRKLQG